MLVIFAVPIDNLLTPPVVTSKVSDVELYNPVSVSVWKVYEGAPTLPETFLIIGVNNTVDNVILFAPLVENAILSVPELYIPEFGSPLNEKLGSNAVPNEVKTLDTSKLFSI